MSVREHALSIALAGWLLMMPPTASDRDLNCASHNRSVGIPDLIWGLVEWKNPSGVNTLRCNSLRHKVSVIAPLREWHRIGQFDTREACEAQYDNNQQSIRDPESAGRIAAARELAQEGETHPSEDQLNLRSHEIAAAAETQTSYELCTQTSDPRLNEQ